MVDIENVKWKPVTFGHDVKEGDSIRIDREGGQVFGIVENLFVEEDGSIRFDIVPFQAPLFGEMIFPDPEREDFESRTRFFTEDELREALFESEQKFKRYKRMAVSAFEELEDLSELFKDQI